MAVVLLKGLRDLIARVAEAGPGELASQLAQLKASGIGLAAVLENDSWSAAVLARRAFYFSVNQGAPGAGLHNYAGVFNPASSGMRLRIYLARGFCWNSNSVTKHKLMGNIPAAATTSIAFQAWMEGLGAAAADVSGMQSLVHDGVNDLAGDMRVIRFSGGGGVATYHPETLEEVPRTLLAECMPGTGYAIENSDAAQPLVAVFAFTVSPIQ